MISSSTENFSVTDPTVARIASLAVMSLVLLVPQLILREPGRHEVETTSNSLTLMIKAIAQRWKFLLPLSFFHLIAVAAFVAAK